MVKRMQKYTLLDIVRMSLDHCADDFDSSSRFDGESEDEFDNNADE